MVRGEGASVRSAPRSPGAVRKTGRVVHAAPRLAARVGHAHQVWLVQKVGIDRRTVSHERSATLLAFNQRPSLPGLIRPSCCFINVLLWVL